MTTYQLAPANIITNVASGVLRTRDGVTCQIPFDPANTDYQEYLEWVAEGNTPEPAESGEE
tara:strand:- start:46 stop:228 length:183 start_codon:yes stop_codon:yes gene_type:complete